MANFMTVRAATALSTITLAAIVLATAAEGQSTPAVPPIPAPQSTPAVSPIPAPQSIPAGYKLIWSDEFDKDGAPDPTKWTYEKGFVRNKEFQWYQPENAICHNGLLSIEARRTHQPNPNYISDSKDWRKNRPFIDYTSACLKSTVKTGWKYGIFEMRGRIDVDPGCWPAWWTLGVERPWPANGEIDIMEYYRNRLLANVACMGLEQRPQWSSKTLPVDSLGGQSWSKQFHIWRMYWDEDSIILTMDGVTLNKIGVKDFADKDGSGFEPFKQPHYMLLNLAIGGQNGGDPQNTSFPRRFEVDYVRVYQKTFPSAVSQKTSLIPVAAGWAKNSINTVVFRKNSLTSYNNIQYIAFYDSTSRLVLGRRSENAESWELKQTQYTGDTRDAHRSISIIVDGDGYLHCCFDQHDSRLRYARGKEPGSLELGPEMPMINANETRVTYPEFYRAPDGNLIFLYRDGASGNGNLVLNRYDKKTRAWTRLQDKLIDGEGKRNAYWQAAMDVSGTLHVSWTWRESPDVASNHDIAYARSRDGGRTWETSTGNPYTLPITATTAEYAVRVPTHSGLINQTSMCADNSGNPYIATYWRPDNSEVPQYMVVYRDASGWHTTRASKRITPFLLGGAGTKRIPLSRPQILQKDNQLFLLYRDEERGNKITLAACQNLAGEGWTIQDLDTSGYGSWEPTYDQQRWADQGKLDIFVQRVGQGDGESLENLPAQPIFVLEWQPTQLHLN